MARCQIDPCLGPAELCHRQRLGEARFSGNRPAQHEAEVEAAIETLKKKRLIEVEGSAIFPLPRTDETNKTIRYKGWLTRIWRTIELPYAVLWFAVERPNRDGDAILDPWDLARRFGATEAEVEEAIRINIEYGRLILLGGRDRAYQVIAGRNPRR